VASIDDLENEVQKLRQQVRRLEGGNAAADNARVVDELVSTADGVASGAGPKDDDWVTPA
jgi:hypothetical protein